MARELPMVWALQTEALLQQRDRHRSGQRLRLAILERSPGGRRVDPDQHHEEFTFLIDSIYDTSNIEEWKNFRFNYRGLSRSSTRTLVEM